MKYKNIASITVTHNPNIDLFSQQIHSLFYDVQRIYVVDNASLNINAIKIVLAEYATKIVLIELSINNGLAYAQNHGINSAINYGCEYILFLDQDSCPSLGMISTLYNEFTELANCGVKVAGCSPVALSYDDKKPYPVLIDNGLLPSYFVPFNGSTVKVVFSNSSGFLCSVSTLKTVGLMMNEFFIDYIDVEWCCRASSLGFQSFVTSKAFMSHAVGDNSSNFFGKRVSVHSPERRYYLFRNYFYLLRLRWIPKGYLLRELFVNIFRFSYAIFFNSERIKQLKYFLFACRDGLFKVPKFTNE